MELRIRYLVGFLFGSLAGHTREVYVFLFSIVKENAPCDWVEKSFIKADPPCFRHRVATSRRNVRQSLHHDQSFVSKRLRANNLEYMRV